MSGPHASVQIAGNVLRVDGRTENICLGRTIDLIKLLPSLGWCVCADLGCTHRSSTINMAPVLWAPANLSSMRRCKAQGEPLKQFLYHCRLVMSLFAIPAYASMGWYTPTIRESSSVRHATLLLMSASCTSACFLED